MWRSEAELVGRFAAILGAERASDDCVLMRELRTGYGVADLALVQVDPEVIRKRRERVVPGAGLSSTAAYVIANLYGPEALELEALGALLRMSRWELQSALGELLDRDLVSLQGSVVSLLDPAERLAIRRVITYEAKLTKWRSAVAQAQRHLWFCSQSYVLLPELSPSLSSSVLGACQRYGVGLVQFCSDGAMKVYPPAESPLTVSTPFLWVLSEFLVEVEDWDHLSLANSRICPLTRPVSASSAGSRKEVRRPSSRLLALSLENA